MTRDTPQQNNDERVSTDARSHLEMVTSGLRELIDEHLKSTVALLHWYLNTEKDHVHCECRACAKLREIAQQRYDRSC